MRSRAAVAATLVVGSLVFVQLILGGAALLRPLRPDWVSGDFVNAHIGIGHSIWLISIAPVVLLWRIKPASRNLRTGGIVLLALSLVQANIIAALGPWTGIGIMVAHGLAAAVIFTTAVALAVATLRA